MKRKAKKLWGSLIERLDMPVCPPGQNLRMEIVSNREATVWGALGITEYKDDCVALRHKKGCVLFCGSGLSCESYTEGTVIVRGCIESVRLQ